MPLSIATSTIVAQAFAELGRPYPASLSEDTDEGQDAARAYAQARDEAIQMTDWSWCAVRVDLPSVTAGLGGVPVADPDLAYLYALPTDCLALRHVAGTAPRWIVEGVWLRSDAPAPLRIRYSRRIENEEQIPPAAKTVIALRMAQLMLPRWGSKDDRRRIDEAFEIALALARRADARTASVQSWLPGGLPPDIVAEAIQ